MEELRDLGGTPIRDLGLTLEGTVLEPILTRFDEEVRALGLTFHPRVYLSTEWGVPFGTIAIAVPFYLAREELRAMQRARWGYLEGDGQEETLRYLRHELGHVINYAFRLYDTPEWVELFGAITQPYLEEYTPEPFSDRFVRHLPGWYAQKHPDEDWAETFAVWMDPRSEWEREYRGTPAFEKLLYCARVMAMVRGREPATLDDALDEPVEEVRSTVEDFFGTLQTREHALPEGAEGALRAAFLVAEHELASSALEGRAPAAELLTRLSLDLPGEIYRWTGYMPERTRMLIESMARRAHELHLSYPKRHESRLLLSLTSLITALSLRSMRAERSAE